MSAATHYRASASEQNDDLACPLVARHIRWVISRRASVIAASGRHGQHGGHTGEGVAAPAAILPRDARPRPAVPRVRDVLQLDGLRELLGALRSSRLEDVAYRYIHELPGVSVTLAIADTAWSFVLRAG